ncbi:alpha/beta hydrolase [Uliginosibacterium sp. TH139]|uniref:alpha/beta hydrolase n=1 Tax=Uliginosibacterium sp. TH139 TaxID=2067453 RepID=UPI000C7A77AE|nr:alpha/beta fold hydrolase [Uliginosibacterium sp. TH139]PLK48502.1 phospholipase [Uliginosibacterium sp. TH139]
MNFRLRSPEVSTQHPPLLVLLHGKGANEDDLFALARHVDPRFLVISLRAPHEMAPGYYRWYERFDSPHGSIFDEEEIEASRQWLVQHIADLVTSSGAAPQQVHILGFSQGGAMALALALTEPRMVQSVVSIAGRLLAACTAQAAPATAMQHLNLLLQHGSQDEVVACSESVTACKYFSKKGAAADLKEYATGHTISPAMLKDALDFLSGQLDGEIPRTDA